MVNRILKFVDDIAANETDVVLDKISPRSGQTYDVLELWTDQNANVEISLSIRERKLFDNIPADDLPAADDGLVYDLTVQEGDELQILASETSGAGQTPAVYVLIDES
jgi:hypothetical protein